VSIQPDRDALNAARVRAEFIELIALGRAVKKCEAHAIPLAHDTLHRMAAEWKSRPMTETEKWVLERLTR
jgi:hypothetical protein